MICYDNEQYYNIHYLCRISMDLDSSCLQDSCLCIITTTVQFPNHCCLVAVMFLLMLKVEDCMSVLSAMWVWNQPQEIIWYIAALRDCVYTNN